MPCCNIRVNLCDNQSWITLYTPRVLSTLVNPCPYPVWYVGDPPLAVTLALTLFTFRRRTSRHCCSRPLPSFPSLLTTTTSSIESFSLPLPRPFFNRDLSLPLPSPSSPSSRFPLLLLYILHPSLLHLVCFAKLVFLCGTTKLPNFEK